MRIAATERRHRGVALITAVLIAGLASIAAVAMISRQQIDVRRTGNMLTTDQAYLFNLGIESWAKRVLRYDREDNTIDHLGEDWATILPPITVEGVVVSGTIEDLQGRFNLNNLIDDGQASTLDVARFRRLLHALGQSEDLANAVVDWLDDDLTPGFPDGAEDEVYLGAEVAYRSANHLMVSPSELLLIQGFTREIYDTMLPYICALPERTDINLNTASAPLLMAVVDGLTPSEADQLVEQREEKYLESVNDFFNDPMIQDKQYDPKGVGVASNFFVIQGNSQFERARISMASIVKRADDGRSEAVLRAQGTP